MTFPLDKEKAIAAALYVFQKYGGETDYHSLFKTLYVADKQHLAKYGRPVSTDVYIAMKYGPVPSNIYDVLKHQQMPDKFQKIGGYMFKSTQAPDLNELSVSDIEELNYAFESLKDLDFEGRVDLSHDAAYDNTNSNTPMSFTDIAKSANANSEEIKYIEYRLGAR